MIIILVRLDVCNHPCYAKSQIHYFLPSYDVFLCRDYTRNLIREILNSLPSKNWIFVAYSVRATFHLKHNRGEKLL